jgi:hypothetical protein
MATATSMVSMTHLWSQLKSLRVTTHGLDQRVPMIGSVVCIDESRS